MSGWLPIVLADGSGDFMEGHMGAGWWWVMGIGWLVFLALVALVLIQFLRRPRDASPASRSAPEDVLMDRFARGEIDEEEFRRRRAALRDG